MCKSESRKKHTWNRQGRETPDDITSMHIRGCSHNLPKTQVTVISGGGPVPGADGLGCDKKWRIRHMTR